MNTEFTLARDKNKVYLSIKATAELEEYDLEELVLDLQHHLVNIKAYNEAKEQNASKLKLEKEMKRVFVDIFDTNGISLNDVIIKAPNKVK